MPDTDLRRDLKAESVQFLLDLGGRLVPRFVLPDGVYLAEWQTVAVFYGLYPGSFGYHIAFPDPTEDNPGDLHVLVSGRSPFGRLNRETRRVDAEWVSGAVVFDGCHGMPDGRDDHDDLMSRVCTAVLYDHLDGWRP